MRVKRTEKMSCKILTILVAFEIFNGGVCQETNENDGEFGVKQPTYEYLQVFRNVPTLFEFLVNSLQERPEILEKDDITVFSQDSKVISKRSIDKRDINEKSIPHTELETPEHNKKQERKRKLPNKYGTRIKKDLRVIDGEEFIDNNYFKRDGNFLSLTGMNLRLSSNEVEENALKVEQMLEDYNRSKRH